MKKHITFLILSLGLSISLSAQSFSWNPKLDLSTRTITYQRGTTLTIPDTLTEYTVQYGEFGRNRNLAGYKYSLSIWSTGLADTIVVDWGGSNHLITGTSRLAFEGLPHDSLPYTWIQSKHLIVDTWYNASEDSVHIDSVYVHSFPDFDTWLFDDFPIKFSEISDTTGVIGVDVLFTNSE